MSERFTCECPPVRPGEFVAHKSYAECVHTLWEESRLAFKRITALERRADADRPRRQPCGSPLCPWESAGGSAPERCTCGRSGICGWCPETLESPADRPAEPLKSGACACGLPTCVWDRSEGTVVTCPHCAFAFDDLHAYHDGTYACPECGHAERGDRPAEGGGDCKTCHGAGWIDVVAKSGAVDTRECPSCGPAAVEEHIAAVDEAPHPLEEEVRELRRAEDAILAVMDQGPSCPFCHELHQEYGHSDTCIGWQIHLRRQGLGRRHPHTEGSETP